MGDKVRHLGLTAAALWAMAGLTVTTADAGGAVTTSLFLSLSGTVSSPSDPCLPNGDIVGISGKVHVVSIVPPDPIKPVRLHFNRGHNQELASTTAPSAPMGALDRKGGTDGFL